MKKLVRANAKINIGLNILEKFPNGYHSLDMVMSPISLYDDLIIEFFNEEGILEITTNKESIPTDEGNIIYKIYNAFYEKTELTKERMVVHLEKRIPHEAGLGGGSSDGAAFLKELNEHYGNILSLEELIKVSKNIGADIPFFLVNKTCRAKGIGEKLEPLENNIKAKILLIKPTFGVSAGEAYSNFSRVTEKKDANLKKIMNGLKENIFFEVIDNVENHLEQALLISNDNIKDFKKELEENFQEKFLMSGSGSVFYTIVDSTRGEILLDEARKAFKDYEVYLCNFL